MSENQLERISKNNTTFLLLWIFHIYDIHKMLCKNRLSLNLLCLGAKKFWHARNLDLRLLWRHAVEADMGNLGEK